MYRSSIVSYRRINAIVHCCIFHQSAHLRGTVALLYGSGCLMTGHVSVGILISVRHITCGWFDTKLGAEDDGKQCKQLPLAPLMTASRSIKVIDFCAN